MTNGTSVGDQQKSDKVQPVHPIVGCVGYGRHFAKEVMIATQSSEEGFEVILQTEIEKLSR